MTLETRNIESDLAYLAGTLPHRGASTDAERTAAEFIRSRISEYTPDTAIDDLYAIESHYYLYAAYYAEFLVVAVLAHWSARLALGYGAAIFLAYLAEFMGYPVFSRMMPRFETQNVVGRFLGLRPRRTFVISAHYDSPRDAAFTHPQFLPWLRTAHHAIIGCMVVVLATCAMDAVQGGEEFNSGVFYVRCIATGLLAGAAVILFHSAVRGDFVRGANTNASGVAALLSLCARFAENRIEEADIYIVATGARGTGMNGLRHFIRTHEVDREHTYFLNIEHVGAGHLHYLTEEGMLQPFHSARECLDAAAAEAARFGATPARLHAIPTETQTPLARGFKAISIVGLDDAGLPPHWHWHTDTLAHVDTVCVARAAGLVEAIIRRLGTLSSE